MGDAEQTIAKIARRLAALVAPGSENTISAGEVREWAVSYLARYDAEMARFPDEAGRTHWNFWMKDFEPGDAVFAAIVFRPSGLEFFCGIGDPFAIKHFGGSEFPDDPEAFSTEMQQRFAVPEGSIVVGSEDAEAWLGGSGWCG